MARQRTTGGAVLPLQRATALGVARPAAADTPLERYAEHDDVVAIGPLEHLRGGTG